MFNQEYNTMCCNKFFQIDFHDSRLGRNNRIASWTHCKVVNNPLCCQLVSIVFSCLFRLSFGGIVLRHYLEANVTRSTRTSIRYFMKMLANISETIIFMFLGLSAMVDTLDWNLSFIFFALLFCLVFRVLGNYTPSPSPFLF